MENLIKLLSCTSKIGNYYLNQALEECSEVLYPYGEDSVDPTIELVFDEGSIIIANPFQRVYDRFVY